MGNRFPANSYPELCREHACSGVFFGERKLNHSREKNSRQSTAGPSMWFPIGVLEFKRQASVVVGKNCERRVNQKLRINRKTADRTRLAASDYVHIPRW